MLVVIALGGNAILQRGQPLEAHIQRENIRAAAASIALVAEHHQVVLTHGNGPQVGLLSLMNEAYEEVSPYPLDVLGAQTQGMIGFMFEQELRNKLPGRKICTISTQTIVDPNDPAFEDPTKFVGPVYTYEEAQLMAEANSGWTIKQDGNYFRRVVPSPEPQEILELPSLQHIISSGDITVICGGGGGIPVRRDSEGLLHGVEAVVDKDRASRVLAEGIGADALLLLTDVDSVHTNYGHSDSKKVKFITPNEVDSFNFAEGSMAPKVESVCHFVRAGGKFGAIGSLEKAAEIMLGQSGTHIKMDVPDNVIYY